MTKLDLTHARLSRLIGAWVTEATHPAMPGTIVRGSANIEWLEGERFLIQHARNDHPDFPDSISIIGVTASDRVVDGQRTVATPDASGLHMHYYDSRGVFRDYDASIDDTALRFERLARGFSQRFTGTFEGDAINGIWELCEDDRSWRDDLKIVYRRSR